MSDVINGPDAEAPTKPAPMHAKPVLAEARARPGRWAELAPALRDKLGFHPDDTPAVITFSNWSPDPWTIVGTNGKNLATLSDINLSVIKAVTTAGAASLYWTLTVNVASQGWTSSDPTEPQVQARLQVELLNAQSGLLQSFAPLFYVECGRNGMQTLSETFTTDVFSLITKAHLSLNATFWPC